MFPRALTFVRAAGGTREERPSCGRDGSPQLHNEGPDVPGALIVLSQQSGDSGGGRPGATDGSPQLHLHEPHTTTTTPTIAPAPARGAPGPDSLVGWDHQWRGVCDVRRQA